MEAFPEQDSNRFYLSLSSYREIYRVKKVVESFKSKNQQQTGIVYFAPEREDSLRKAATSVLPLN